MKNSQDKSNIKAKKDWRNYWHNFTAVLGALIIIIYLIYFTILWEEWQGVKSLFGNNNPTMLLMGLATLVVGGFIYGSNRKNFSPIKWIIYISLFFISGILLNSIVGFIIWIILLTVVGLEVVFNFSKFRELKIGFHNDNSKDK
ncbi:LPXTG cell wall anchor domain-containing protein [Spiroplasma diminutum]|uniref:Transmembrane protein n=1 Tax=Spiroplasma diminutum CUAS-1 TaxID=1276221 RepID=S5M048_9MOLU|nr:LPXTG cell wall anchor domain-containing protein [Spiroplasma diminutum]AGR42211.1 hypothetical protein SDIMI_v3c05070 [Spiroplasma diminutum CUAS-1]